MRKKYPAMPKITVRYEYDKLHGQKTARLERIVTKYLSPDADYCKSFLEYNTLYGGDKHEYIAEGVYDVLYFTGEHDIPFTILRRQTYDSIKYYNENLGKDFKIVLEAKRG